MFIVDYFKGFFKNSGPVSIQQAFKAASIGDVKTLQKFIDEGGNINVQNPKIPSETLLSVATKGDAVKFLLEHGADVQHSSNCKGHSILYNSALEPKAALELVKAGLEVDGLAVRNLSVDSLKTIMSEGVKVDLNASSTLNGVTTTPLQGVYFMYTLLLTNHKFVGHKIEDIKAKIEFLLSNGVDVSGTFNDKPMSEALKESGFTSLEEGGAPVSAEYGFTDHATELNTPFGHDDSAAKTPVDHH